MGAFWKNVIGILLILTLIGTTSFTGQIRSRIINGNEAVTENTKHQVSVRMKEHKITFGFDHICGGSLIKPNIVISAAHCFYDDNQMKFNSVQNYYVVMGTLDRFKENTNTISYNINYISYPDFNIKTFKNDLALVFLDGTVPETNPAVSVIAINKEEIRPGTLFQVTGWGTMETGHSARLLKTVDVPIIDRITCSINYGKDTITDGMICAGYMKGGKDACQGDSGGPLVNDGKLVGVVSFGIGCAEPGYPGVYTDVKHFIDWIEENIVSSELGVPK